MRSSLARHVVQDPTSPDELRAKARAAWHRTPRDDDTWLCVRLGDVIDPFERQALINVGNRIYGKRGGQHG
jgi:hypothetical protein